MSENVGILVDTVRDELDESLSMDGVIDFMGLIPGCIAGEPISIGKMSALAKDKAVSIFQKFPLHKFVRYLAGVKKVEEDLGGAVRLSDKLFGKEKNRDENAARIYKNITDCDTDKKIDYMVNATKVFLCGVFELDVFFRIIKAISETLPEDLSLLKLMTEKELKKQKDIFAGNISVLALARSGLVIGIGVDCNKSVEEQDYTITKLGYLVDRYALSIDDEEKQKLYKRVEQKESILTKVDLQTMSEKDISELFSDDSQEKGN